MKLTNKNENNNNESIHKENKKELNDDNNKIDLKEKNLNMVTAINNYLIEN